MATISQTRTVTSQQLKKALRVAIKIKRPAMILGAPGIGKSDVVQQLCDEMGGKLYDVRLGLCDISDIKGLPYLDKDSKTMMFAPPVDLPTAEDAAKYPVVFLFLDELNSAPPSVQGAAYSLILNRRVGQYMLPDNVVIVAAGNRDNDRGVTYKTPKPLSNRLLNFEMRVDFDSWYEYALEKKLNSSVVGFLDFSKSSLNDFDPMSPERSFATPRSWEFVSQILSDDSIDTETVMELVASSVGSGMALKFMSHRKMASKLPAPEDILSGKITELTTKEISVTYTLIAELNYVLKDRWAKLGGTKNEDKWHEAADFALGFAMKNFSTEIQVLFLRNAMQKFNLPFTPKKLTNFKEYYEKVGKLIIKSVS